VHGVGRARRDERVSLLPEPVTLDAREGVQHLLDRRPRLAVLLQAPERQLGDQRHLLRRRLVGAVPEAEVHQLLQPALLDLVDGHAGQVDVAAAAGQVHGGFGRDELHEHDAEAVHVAPVRQLVALVVLWIHVPTYTCQQVPRSGINTSFDLAVHIHAGCSRQPGHRESWLY
jgi:hypothetical protein